METLRSLQDITIGTGLSVIPYFVEVDLLNILIKLITNEKDNEVIKEASKTIAILGTLDYNVINSMVKVDDISKVMKYYKENDFDNLTLCVDNTKTNRIEIVSHGTAAYDPVTD